MTTLNSRLRGLAARYLEPRVSGRQLAAGQRFYDALHEYRVEETLCIGGFGLTYLATDSNLNLKVAIKEYLPGDLAQRGDDQSVRPKAESAFDSFKWGLSRFLEENPHRLVAREYALSDQSPKQRDRGGERRHGIRRVFECVHVALSGELHLETATTAGWCRDL